MNTLLTDERPALGGETRTGRTEVCDPQTSVSEIVGDMLKDFRSRNALIQLGKISVLMAATPWLLSYVADWLHWDGELWAKASLVGINAVIGLYVLLAWQEDQDERQEHQQQQPTAAGGVATVPLENKKTQ